jgi:hypothetical protein
VAQIDANAHGEVLEPGRATGCYLGLLLAPGSAGEPEVGIILIVPPAALLHPRVPQPDGSLVYGLLTGHPDREARRAGIRGRSDGGVTCLAEGHMEDCRRGPKQVAQAVVSCWQAGEDCRSAASTFEEARSLTRPAMTYVRGQLRGRLTIWLGRAYQRWLHFTSGRRDPATGSWERAARGDRRHQPLRLEGRPDRYWPLLTEFVTAVTRGVSAPARPTRPAARRGPQPAS